jgi:UDP-galactopyranose mutase
VFFIEEPVFDAAKKASYSIAKAPGSDVNVVVPHLPAGMNEEEIISTQRSLLDALLTGRRLSNCIFWYYSPMARLFSHHLSPGLIVYDCMDELSAFMFAPPMLKSCEAELIQRADLLLTGGYSLYTVKKELHKNTYCFPSSIDKAHFNRARAALKDPVDQAGIPWPRIGFFGVIDERLNTALVKEVAALRPGWHFILVGPIVKIDPATLPNLKNIHYLGMKQYRELPAYLSGWDIAMMPFALNEATRFISPTKTPEYLAGGKPVITTSIKDVIHTYGDKKMVQVADTPEDFIRAAECFLSNRDKTGWIAETDALLADMSWDGTAQSIAALMEQGLAEKAEVQKTQNF